jgi:hypothetical protein
VNFDYTFTLTLCYNTLRVFLIIIAIEDLKCYAINVNNAFIELTLKEEIYMVALPRMDLLLGYVLKVLRSLYSLKQAVRD